MNEKQDFWGSLDTLLATSRLVIDRPKGTHHPKWHDCVYPFNYGYLEGTVSMDGQGIDVCVGSLEPDWVQAVICTVDLFKKDSEIKLMLGFTEEELQEALTFFNSGAMHGLLIRR